MLTGISGSYTCRIASITFSMIAFCFGVLPASRNRLISVSSADIFNAAPPCSFSSAACLRSSSTFALLESTLSGTRIGLFSASLISLTPSPGTPGEGCCEGAFSRRRRHLVRQRPNPLHHPLQPISPLRADELLQPDPPEEPFDVERQDIGRPLPRVQLLQDPDQAANDVGIGIRHKIHHVPRPRA